MPQNYDYIKLIGIVIFISSLIKIFLGFLKYSYGNHYLSSLIILALGVGVYSIGIFVQRKAEVEEE